MAQASRHSAAQIDPRKVFFLALAALPLPVWPFYLLGEFDPGAHLECYATAYFPTVQAEFSKPDLHLSRDSQRLTVSLPINERVVSARLTNSDEASFSYYVEGVGAVAISSKRSPSDSQNLMSSPSEKLELLPLSDLQYDGSVLASKLVRSFSGVTLQAHTYFDERAGHIREITHRRLIDFIESLRALNEAQDPVTLIPNFFTMPDGSLGVASR